MIGAIIGDMAGCRFERHAHQPGLDPLDFPLFSERTSFTDDTVLSFAVSEALMESKGDSCKYILVLFLFLIKTFSSLV